MSVQRRLTVSEKNILLKEEDHLKLVASVFTYVKDAVMITDAKRQQDSDPIILYVNDAYMAMTGYFAAEVLGKSCNILHGPKTDKKELEKMRNAMLTGNPCEITVLNCKKNGDEFWLNSSIFPVANVNGQFTHWVFLQKEIIISKNPELDFDHVAALEEGLIVTVEKLLRERNTILESIGDAFFAVDNNWIVTYWNNIAEKVLGKSREEMVNHMLWEVFSDSINSNSYKKYHLAVTKKRIIHFEDFYAPLQKWYGVSAYPSENGLSVYFTDITEKKTIEMLLIDSEQRYSELFQLSPLPKWVFDINTLAFLDVNQAAISHYGYSKDEFLSMTIRDIRPPEDLVILDNVLNLAKSNVKFIKRGVFTHLKKSGELIKVEIQSNSITYKGKEAKIIIANDITKNLAYIEAVELQNEKLRDISWIQSHLIRAPLARIMGLVQLARTFDGNQQDKNIILDSLLWSANELDVVIKDITNKSKAAKYEM